MSHAGPERSGDLRFAMFGDVDNVTSKMWKPVLGLIGTLGQIHPFISTLNQYFKLKVSDSVDGIFPPGKPSWSPCDANGQGGILNVTWLNKLLEDWPSALCFCLQYENVAGDPTRWAIILKSLHNLKTALGLGAHPPGGILIVLGTDELGQVPKDRLELLSFHSGVGKGSIFMLKNYRNSSEIDRLVKFLQAHAWQSYQKAGAHIAPSCIGQWHNLQQATRKAVLDELANDYSKSLYEYEMSCSMIIKALARAESLAESAMLLAHSELVFARMSKIYRTHNDLDVLAEKFRRYLEDCKVFVSSIDKGSNPAGHQVGFLTSAKLLYAGWLFRQYSNVADILIEGDFSVSDQISARALDPSSLYLSAAYSFASFRALCQDFVTKSPEEMYEGALPGPWLGSYEVNKAPITTNEDFDRHVLSKLAWKESQSEDVMIGYLEKAKMCTSLELEDSKRSRHRLLLIKYLLGKEYLHVGNLDLAKQYLIRSFRQYHASHWYGAALESLLLLRACFAQTKNYEQHILCSLLCSSLSTMREELVIKGIVSAALRDLQRVRETPITLKLQGPDGNKDQEFCDLSLVFKAVVGWYRDKGSIHLVFGMRHSLQVNLQFAGTIEVITSDSDDIKQASIVERSAHSYQREFKDWIYWSMELHQPRQQNAVSFQQSVVKIGPSAKLVISSAACNAHLPNDSANIVGQNIIWSNNLPPDFCSPESIIFQVPECIIKEEIWPIHINAMDFIQSRPAMCQVVMTDQSAHKNQCNFLSLGLSAEEVASNQAKSSQILQEVNQQIVFDEKGSATVWAVCRNSCSLKLFLSDIMIKSIPVIPISPVVIRYDFFVRYETAETSYVNATDGAEDGKSKSLIFPCGSYPTLITVISNNAREAITLSKASVSWSNGDVISDAKGPVSDVFPILLNETQDLCQLSFRVPTQSEPRVERIEAELHLECRRYATSPIFSYRHPITASLCWVAPKVKARVYFDKESGPVGSTISMNLELRNFQVPSGLFTVEVSDSENFLIKGKKLSCLGCAVGSVAHWKVGLIPHRVGYFPFPKLTILGLGEEKPLGLDRETSGLLFVH